MTTLGEFHAHAEAIERMMLLRTYRLAVKMLESEADVPEGAIRPERDLGYHLTQCQAFTLSRRRGLCIAMLKDDSWCWGPIMAYGLVDQRIAERFPEIRDEVKRLPLIEHDRYVGIVSAPLRTATFVPDIVVIYSNVAQLNNMLHSLSFAGEGKAEVPLYPIASCAWSVVPSQGSARSRSPIRGSWVGDWPPRTRSF